MADFIFTRKLTDISRLETALYNIYPDEMPVTWNFSGDWGQLAVTKSPYNGFQPWEDETTIAVIVGAPALYFTDNEFLKKNDGNFATEAITLRWKNDQLDPSNDLSGPFLFLFINKKSHAVHIVTDLMGFIPAYLYQENEQLTIGTHVDCTAKVAGEQHNFDPISIADFVIHSTVTFPYTTYHSVRQLYPGSYHQWINKNEYTYTRYWIPSEDCPYRNIREAAHDLRTGLQKYINTVTQGMDLIAHFISAGEDSRALCGALSHLPKRDAYIFLDKINREGKFATKIADLYGSQIHTLIRRQTFYIDILEIASKLVGSGHQFKHAHCLEFHKECNLSRYPAVFGGYFSDSLLKGAYAPQKKGSKKYSFLPEIAIHNPKPTMEPKRNFLDQSTIDQVLQRRKQHLQQVKVIRPNSAYEWFLLWPATMRHGMPNYYTTRRLFRSYEPFMSHEAVKVGAAAPIHWKLNRRLFRIAMAPFLKPSKWVRHPNGHLPYFPFYANIPIQLATYIAYRIQKLLGVNQKSEGPWGDWNIIKTTTEWAEKHSKYSELAINFLEQSVDEEKFQKHSKTKQSLNMLQIGYHLNQAFYRIPNTAPEAQRENVS